MFQEYTELPEVRLKKSFIMDFGLVWLICLTAYQLHMGYLMTKFDSCENNRNHNCIFQCSIAIILKIALFHLSEIILSLYKII